MYVFLVSMFTSFHLFIYKFIITYFLNLFCPFLPSFLSLLSILSLPYLHMSWHSLLLICIFYFFIYFCFDIYIYFSHCVETYCTCVNVRVIHAPVVFMYSLRMVECSR